MDFFCVDTPPPEIAFELGEDDDSGSEHLESVSDEDFFDACLASADLRELGLSDVSAAMGWRAWRTASYLFEEYRAARAAADTGCPQAAQRLKTASSRLLQATHQALTDFVGWNSAEERRE